MQKSNPKISLCYILILAFLLEVVQVIYATTSSYQIIHSSGFIQLPIRPLHIEGRYIEDDLGRVVHLRGVCKATFLDCSEGWWSDGDWGSNYGYWDENVVRRHLQAMKNWGINVLRLHTSAEAWLTNWKGTINPNMPSNMAFRDAVKRTIELAGEYGIYVVYDVYSAAIGEGQNLLPWPPWSPYDVLPDPAAFVNFWVSVVSELKNYPNVLFELYNEPGGNQTEWFQTVQLTVNAIRNIPDDHIMIVQWGYCGGFDWLRTYRINGTNILYSNHIYRTLDDDSYRNTFPNAEYTYEEMKNVLLNTRDYAYVLQNNIPIWIGETGCWESRNPTFEEKMYFTNLLKILNEWEVGYAVWEWFQDDARIEGLIATPWQKGTMPSPNIAGQILINAIKGELP
jgi:hypothetical protein